MHLFPARNHRVPGLEYPFFWAQNDSNSELICSSFIVLFPQPYSSCSKTCGRSLTAQTMLIKFKIPATSVHVMHNTQVCTETSIIFVLSLYCRQLVLDVVAPSVAIREVDPTHYSTMQAHVLLRQSRAILNYFQFNKQFSLIAPSI